MHDQGGMRMWVAIVVMVGAGVALMVAIAVTPNDN
jgi:hypothetical protein